MEAATTVSASTHYANDICEAVAALQRTIALVGVAATAGFPVTVQAAYPYMQWDGSALNCPFFANDITGGPTDFLASGALQQVDSTVEMFLCLLPWEQGGTLEGNLEYALRWRDVVFAAFARELRLGGLPNVLEAHIVEWNKERLEYGSGEFVALRFNLAVRETFTLAVGS